VEKALLALGLIRDREVTCDIFHKETLLGQIVVVWRDRSIYFCSYAVLVFLLLVVIANLYSKVYGSKKDLEEKVHVIETTLTEQQGQKEYIEEIFNVVPEGLLAIDEEKNGMENNRSFDLLIESWATRLQQEHSVFKDTFLADLRKQLLEHDSGQYAMTVDAYTISIEYSSAPLSFHTIHRVVSLRDITKMTAIERQLAQSQKLEAVGRLAAGIAHEINTPTQYVLTNMDFLTEAHEDIADIMEQVQRGSSRQKVRNQ
jgi:transcriptional regulator with PAS, ATPase and Fis domain